MWIIIDHQFIIMVIKDNHHFYWLVVSTPLKNIGQLGLLFPIYGEKKMFQTTNQYMWLSLFIIDSKSSAWSYQHHHHPRFGAASSADAMCTWNSMTFSVKPARLHNESIWAGRGHSFGKMYGHTDGKWWKRMEIPWNTFGGDFLPVFFPRAFEDSQIKSK